MINDNCRLVPLFTEQLLKTEEPLLQQYDQPAVDTWLGLQPVTTEQQQQQQPGNPLQTLGSFSESLQHKLYHVID